MSLRMATKPPIIIGWRETVALPELGIQEAYCQD
jgi:hypothetical protein